MNHLHIGTEGLLDWLLTVTKPRFLLIDDGPIADAFLARFPKARLFDPTVHSFNPLTGMDYKRACDFVSVLQSVFAAGRDTLTKEGAWDVWLEALLDKPQQLDQMLLDESRDPGYISAQRMARRLLRSPVLRSVLCGEGKPFRFGEGTTVARLDRAQLGDFDAFVLGSLLIGQHKGQVVVPDFGFYGRPLHLSLMRQQRLTAGLNFLEEVAREFRQALLTIPDKHGEGCTFEDAEILASYSGLKPGDVGHTEFVQRAMEHPRA
jgi:hypothetical protein